MKKGCFWAIGAIVVVLLLGWSAWAWTAGQRQAKLALELKRCREAGLPFTIEPEKVVSSMKDGGRQLKLAFQGLRMSGMDGDIQNWMAKPKAAADTVKLLDDNAKVLALLTEFSTADRTSFRPTMSRENWQLPQPNVQVSSLMSLLLIKTEWESRQGKPFEALQSLGVAIRVINLMTAPEDFRYLYERATESKRICDELGTLLGRHGSDPKFLSAVKTLLPILMPTPNIRKTVGRESAKGWVFIHSGKLSPEPEYDVEGTALPREDQAYVSKDVIWALKVSSTRASLLSRYLKHYREWYTSLPEDSEMIPSVLGATNAAEARLNSGGDQMTQLVQELSDRMAGQEIPEIFETVEWRKLLQIELAILERYNRDHKWPHSLASEIGGDVQDPFSHKPLAYSVSKDGFVLYSFGKDGMDDHGRPWRISQVGRYGPGSRGTDIVVHYKNASKAP